MNAHKKARGHKMGVSYIDRMLSSVDTKQRGNMLTCTVVHTEQRQYDDLYTDTHTWQRGNTTRLHRSNRRSEVLSGNNNKNNKIGRY